MTDGITFPTIPELLFQFAGPDGTCRPLRFTNPVEVIVAHRVDQVRPALQKIQRAVDAGLYAAGYLSYEAAPAFDSAYVVHHHHQMPLLWFGLFTAPVPDDSSYVPAHFEVSSWQSTTTRDEYQQTIASIREAIARGDTYQVNYTIRLQAQFTGDDRALFQHMVAAQRSSYSAYLNLGRYRVLSASPELFFHLRDGTITCRPMKGTAKRGLWREHDAAQAQWLAASEKNRAENLMIVDLLRNDIGRVAKIGSVAVPDLFKIERYPTVYQMTSAITAKLATETTLEDVLAALFPCGSITGAPKASTMQHIAQLETAPRDVYCGTIGFVTPDREAVFNVAIRTMQLDTQMGTAVYGVGGGITWDSTAADEYAEALAKAALLTYEQPSFELIESLRFQAGAFTLLERHIERITASATYFDIPLDPAFARNSLTSYASKLPDGVWKIRLLASQQGSIRVEHAPLTELPSEPLPVRLAQRPISRHNRFLYHKTTFRQPYDAAREHHQDVFDVLLRNEDGELTEFTIGNLVVALDGQLWTPARACGLLAGTLRDELIASGMIRERVLKLDDVQRASNLWLINSVRGWLQVHLVPESSSSSSNMLGVEATLAAPSSSPL